MSDTTPTYLPPMRDSSGIVDKILDEHYGRLATPQPDRLPVVNFVFRELSVMALLTDIQHWCESNHADFQNLQNMATHQFQTERKKP